MISFSIVIPVYKTKEYLDQCVQSVIAQNYENFEIILVDDGSPDCCGQMCDAWAEKDPRIQVIHQENSGLSAARNTGIFHAAGDYVMFLDSDDWWEDESVLAAVARNLDRTDADVLSFNYRKSYDGILDAPYFSERLLSSETGETLGQMLRNDRWVNGACNKAIRRMLLTENNLYFRTGITSEDMDWTLRLALHSQRFAFENTCVFVYRQIASSISHSASLTKIECLCDNIRECVRLLHETESEKMELLKPFVAYQYGTLLYNVANLPAHQRSEKLIDGVREMKWLLSCSDNRKVRLLRSCMTISGLSVTLVLLRGRHLIRKLIGKGV